MATSMGLGILKSPFLTGGRKFRWTFQGVNRVGEVVKESYVKVSSRPAIDVDGQELIDAYGNKVWISGRQSWNPIEITWYDASDKSYDAIQAVVDNQMKYASRSTPPTITGILRLYDGCAYLMEAWKLENMWVKSCDFDTTYPDEHFLNIQFIYQAVEYFYLCPKLGETTVTKLPPEWVYRPIQVPIRQLLGIIT